MSSEGVNAFDEEFFGSQEADNAHGEERNRQLREIEAIRRVHYVSGVREGISKARDSHLQNGFDDGFAAGAAAIAQPAFLLGACSFMEALLTKHGCNPRAQSKSQMLADNTEVLTEDMVELSSVVVDMRKQLDEAYEMKVFGGKRASDICKKLSTVEVPSFEDEVLAAIPNDTAVKSD